MDKLKVPEGFVEVANWQFLREEELKGCFLLDSWGSGGIFEYGNERGFSAGSSWYSSITGDCLNDHIDINNMKVYKNTNSIKENYDVMGG